MSAPTFAPLAPRLRVLVINPFGELGGAEIYLLRLLDATDRLDVRALLLRDGPLRGELERRGVPVTTLDVGRTGRAVANAAWRVRRILREHRPDIVLANGVKAQAVVGPAAAVAGVPVLWIKHDHSYDRALTQLLARLARTVVATAEDVAAASGRQDTVLIRPTRPDEPCSRLVADCVLAAAGLCPTSDRLRVAMMTRLTPYKGVDVAIRALASAPRWELVVLGGADPSEPGERQRLLDLARSCGVAERVHLLGHVPDAATLLTAFDALAVLTRDGGPRTPGREGFGMAAMEAMVAGVPVIAPDDGGSVARRTADGAGVLVDVTDPLPVAAALRELEDDSVRGRMSVAARVGATQFDTARRAAEQLVELLCEAAGRPGAGVVDGPPVSVVSPVLNEARVLDRLVPPVLSQLRSDDEFVLVDSGSRDGTRETLRRWQQSDPRIRLVEVDRCSIGGSRNHGVAAARHDLVVCTDAGCRPDDDWLGRMRAALAAPSAPDLVVGTYRVAIRPRRRFEMAMAAVAWPDPQEARGAGPLVTAWTRTVGPRFTAHRVDGRSVGFRKDAFHRAGGFPAELATAEDEAFGRAVRSSGGHAVLLVDATVTWWQRDSMRAAYCQFRGYGRGGGAGRSRLLLGNDVVRAAGYVGMATALASRSGAGRLLAGVGLLMVFGVPAHRLVRRRQPLSTVLLLPVAQLTKDGGKLVGLAEATLLGRSGALPRPRQVER